MWSATGISLAAALMTATATPAQATDAELRKFASEIGSLIAGESFCGYQLDQAAVDALILERLPPGDLSFAETLHNNVAYAKLTHDGMSPTAKSAYCAVLKAAGTSLGLIR